MMKDIAQYLHLGVTIILCILFGLVVGYGIDSLLKSGPTFMIFGIVAGTILSFMVLYRMSRRNE